MIIGHINFLNVLPLRYGYEHAAQDLNIVYGGANTVGSLERGGKSDSQRSQGRQSCAVRLHEQAARDYRI